MSRLTIPTPRRRVRFLQSLAGVDPRDPRRELLFQAGEVLELPAELASLFTDGRRAEYLDEAPATFEVAALEAPETTSLRRARPRGRIPE